MLSTYFHIAEFLFVAFIAVTLYDLMQNANAVGHLKINGLMILMSLFIVCNSREVLCNMI